MARILVSAYACEPGRGSEPGVGWSWVRAMARDHQVTVITRANNRPSIEAALEPELARNLTFAYFDLGQFARFLKRHGLPTQAYYLLWQMRIRPCARRLSQSEPFDVAHHLTFAVDWLPAGVFAADSRFRVWGPVGGSTKIPRGMWQWLPWKARVAETARSVVVWAGHRMWGNRIARTVDLVLVQNQDGLALPGRVVVMPNVVVPDELVTYGEAVPPRKDAGKTAVVIGRLVAWKAHRLALTAFAGVASSGWRLDVIGDGPERGSLERETSRLGLEGHVRFLGWIPREQVMDCLSEAEVLLLPSLHEAAGFAFAEAVTLGVPVVALEHGGASSLVTAESGCLVPTDQDVVSNLSRALTLAGQRRPVPDERWLESRILERVQIILASLVGTSTRGASGGGL